MSSLSSEQVTALTQRVNERLAEFGVGNVGTVSRGVVRLTHDVIREYYLECAEPTAYLNGQPATTISAATSDDFTEFEAAWPAIPDLDGVDVFAHYGEPTGTLAELDEALERELERVDDAIPTPLEGLQIIAPPPLPAPATNGRLEAVLKTPRTLAEIERTAQLRADLEAIIAFIRSLSVHGRMPSQLEYQVKRPKHLPSWITITQRYEIVTWRQMAELCGLLYETARRPQAASVEVEDTDDATEDDDADLLDDDSDFDEDADDSGDDAPPAKRKKPAGKRAKTGRKMGYEQMAAKKGPKPRGPATREELVKAVQSMAMGNVMPTQSQFNAAKPAVWPVASSLMQMLGLSWEQLREEAGLKPNPRWARTWENKHAAL